MYWHFYGAKMKEGGKPAKQEFCTQWKKKWSQNNDFSDKIKQNSEQVQIQQT